MYSDLEKRKENNNDSIRNEVVQRQSSEEPTFQLVDNRPEAVAQRKLQEMANSSPQVKQAAQLQEMANSSLQIKQAVQLQAMANNYMTQQAPVQKKENPEPSQRENNTGLPDKLKSGIESLSGYAMNDVKVHYNSDKPAQLQAHAYAQGTDIHLGAGQEKHLAHEAWHVVQQKQGRVKPTLQMKGQININDNAGLEKEADVMGAKAERSGAFGARHQNDIANSFSATNTTTHPIQRQVYGALPFVINCLAPLTAAAAARLISVVNTLVTTLHNDNNIHVQQLVISVEKEGGLSANGQPSTIAGDNPAETTTTINPPDPFPSIQITVQRPFAEVATEGEMLGLLAHEIGVHNIPSDFRGINDDAVNVFPPIQTPRKIAKNNTPSRGYEFGNWPAPVNGSPAGWDGNRQHDHVMVADILRNPPPVGGPAPLTRANVYFQTVLDIGDTIWADQAKSPAERGDETAELVHLYLVDIARIIATDDGRMPPLRHTKAINDVYGELFNQVVLPRKAAHPWIPQQRPKSNRFALGISLAVFIGKVKLEKKRRG